MKPKIIFLFLLMVTIYFITACSKDEAVIDNLPRDFEIKIDSITTYSARIVWTEPLNNNLKPLYSIYLNDSLIKDSINGFDYRLNDLTAGKDYSIDVIAANEYGNSSQSSSFRTLEQITLFLSRYTLGSGYSEGYQEYHFDLTYYENNKIQQIGYYFGEWPGSYSNGFTAYIIYDYDQNWNLSKAESFNWYDGFSLAEYSFNDSNIATLLLESGVVDDYHREIIQFGQNGLSFRRESWLSDFADFYRTGIRDYSLIIDESGNLDQVKIINVETQGQLSLSFKYLDGNLTEISSSKGDLWEITYDNSHSFHTYESGFEHIELQEHNRYLKDFAGLLFLDEEILSKIMFLPPLYKNRNKNNPLEYKKNGEVYMSFQYEYNEYNYPIKIVQLEEQKEIILEYY